MSPAGYWPQLHAAVEAGADSVYFGLRQFTARAKVGFSPEELPEAVRTLHRRGVKAFITFNTLVFEDELLAASRAIATIAEAGADAIIVQDLGILKLVREIAPALEIHASTQMSITSAPGVEFARTLGASRVTLARELSLAEIRAIRSETDCELEIFVHGALCVAYSGQCFSSEAWGGRSANRGQCAQACRLPYDLIVDGTQEPLADARYLLSPGDLCTLEHVPEIAALGISTLKIEGRYKDAEYVALTTRAYRQAVDSIPVDALDKLRLEQVYSRGLGAHFLSGTNHQTVVQGRAPRHRGVLAGRVVGVLPQAVEIEPEPSCLTPLKPGDGIVFDAADWRSPQEPEEGGRLYETVGRELRFGNGVVNFSRIRAGDLVWRTHDPEVDRFVKPYLAPSVPLRKQPVDVYVRAHVGSPLETVWSVGGFTARGTATEPLAQAQNSSATQESIRAQLSRLGNTVYELCNLTSDLVGSPFIPASLLNEQRRAAVEQLQLLQGQPKAIPTAKPEEILARVTPKRVSKADEKPQLHLLVRTPEQLEAALLLSPASITLDYLDLYGLKPSVERVKSANIAVRIASPRILKPGEERIVDFLVRLKAPILVRSSGLLQTLRGNTELELICDFSLNAANSIGAVELLGMGASRITPTHDLNAAQIATLAAHIGGRAMEVVAYQHLPVFHTEHCVFCRFLSTGTSYKDCGRPCETHVVSLRDQNGRSHPLVADVGCRNTVFGAESQEASAHLGAWREAGIYHFRLEFAHESAHEVTGVTQSFVLALSGAKTYVQLGQELKRLSPQGTTSGSLFIPILT